MNVGEANRQYQAVLEARRAAYLRANADEVEEMDAELERTRQQVIDAQVAAEITEWIELI